MGASLTPNSARAPLRQANNDPILCASPPRANRAAGVEAAGETIPMQKPVVVLLAMLLAAAGSAHGEEARVGRYQMVVVPASQSQTFPEALLLDTATGQSWILYHETGQAIQWLPLRFWGGKDRPATPLPPS